MRYYTSYKFKFKFSRTKILCRLYSVSEQWVWPTINKRSAFHKRPLSYIPINLISIIRSLDAERIEYRLAVLVYRCQHGLAPSYLAEELHRVADTIRYDSGYLTCGKKLTGSQLSLPHGINGKLKCETKNKMMSVISPVRSRYHEAVQ